MRQFIEKKVKDFVIEMVLFPQKRQRKKSQITKCIMHFQRELIEYQATEY